MVPVEQPVAALTLSSRLAEVGARVVKVERPEGDFARGTDPLMHGHESTSFVWLNRGPVDVLKGEDRHDREPRK